MPFLQFNKGCEDDDSGGDDLCNMLASLPHLLHPGELQQGHIQAALHPAGLFVHLLAGHEFHYVQPHHLLLSKPKVNAHYITGRRKIIDVNTLTWIFSAAFALMSVYLVIPKVLSILLSLFFSSGSPILNAQEVNI